MVGRGGGEEEMIQDAYLHSKIEILYVDGATLINIWKKKRTTKRFRHYLIVNTCVYLNSPLDLKCNYPA